MSQHILYVGQDKRGEDETKKAEREEREAPGQASRFLCGVPNAETSRPQQAEVVPLRLGVRRRADTVRRKHPRRFAP